MFAHWPGTQDGFLRVNAHTLSTLLFVSSPQALIWTGSLPPHCSHCTTGGVGGFEGFFELPSTHRTGVCPIFILRSWSPRFRSVTAFSDEGMGRWRAEVSSKVNGRGREGKGAGCSGSTADAGATRGRGRTSSATDRRSSRRTTQPGGSLAPFSPKV